MKKVLVLLVVALAFTSACDNSISGELKIVSHNITIDGSKATWEDTDVSVTNSVNGEYGGNFSIGEDGMFAKTSYRIILRGLNLNNGNAVIIFEQGQTINSFTQSGGFDIQLDPPQGSSTKLWDAVSYSGNSQGFVKIDELKYDDDNEITSMKVTFNNVICQEWEETTRTINGSISVER